MCTPPSTSAAAIQHHYDLGDDFYRLFLDPTLAYSCAKWDDAEADDQLEAAQRRKLAHHVGRARAAGAGHVLDVGCGWGAQARYCVAEAGVGRVTGLTLSRAQAAYIAAHPTPGVGVRLEGWADHSPAEPYDAVISVGAFEHFARPSTSEAEKEAAYRAFFARCHDWLKPGAWLSLQTIAYNNYDPASARGRPEHRFLLGDIFPEAELPTLENVVRATDGLFEIVELRNDREDYDRTCRVWLDRLTARKAEAVAVAGVETYKRYTRYLRISAGLFRYGLIGLLRVAFRRIDEPRMGRR